MFKLILNKPIKDAQLQKLANQSMLNGTLVIEMVNVSKKARKALVVWGSAEHANQKKLKYGQWKIYLQ